jgi:hypothetical protein
MEPLASTTLRCGQVGGRQLGCDLAVRTASGHHGINPLSRTGLADFERILGLSPD